MVKTISFVTNLEDIEDFEKHFCENVCPLILQTYGVVGVRVTSLFQMSLKIAQPVKGVQLMVEVYYESMEALNRTINSNEGQQLFELVTHFKTGQISIFVGKEKNFYPSDLNRINADAKPRTDEERKDK